MKKRHPLIKEISVHLLSNYLDDKGGVTKRGGVTGGHEFVLVCLYRLILLVVQNSADMTPLRLYNNCNLVFCSEGCCVHHLLLPHILYIYISHMEMHRHLSLAH